MIGLSRVELEAVFARSWSQSKNAADVAEAIQAAVLDRLGLAVTPIRPTGRGRKQWFPEPDHRIALIADAVAASRGLTADALRSGRRLRLYALARHEAVWLARVTLGSSYPDLGEAFGGRDHTTILMACRNIQGLVDADPAYGERLRGIAAGALGEDRKAA